MYSLLVQIISKQRHFSQLVDILIGRKNDFWVAGMCNNIFPSILLAQENRYRTFAPFLLEQPMKFVLSQISRPNISTLGHFVGSPRMKGMIKVPKGLTHGPFAGNQSKSQERACFLNV